jgi:Asp-tRNA(Asn)/Glu-tRNA(Gln) amidotransferase A subunit family amidase
MDGLPLGISVLGAPGSDHRLLALAEAVMATEPSTTRGSER